MSVAELEKMLDGLNEENYQTAVKFILFLAESQKTMSEDVDVNGFTSTEVNELKRRFADIRAGKFEKHELLDGENS